MQCSAILTLYVAAGASIYKTTNGGAMWTLVNAGLPTTQTFTGLAIDASGALYAGNAVGALFKSSDGAGTSGASGDVNAALRTVVAHPAKPGVVYVGSAAGVHRSTDGSSFAAFNAGPIPEFASVDLARACLVRRIALAPAATDRGVPVGTSTEGARTHDARRPPGASTAGRLRRSLGLGNANVFSLACDRADPTIVYAGTIGGGVYEATP